MARLPYTRHEKFLSHGIVICRDFNMDEMAELKESPDGFIEAAERFAMFTPQKLLRRTDGKWATAGRFTPLPEGHRLVAELEYIPQQ